MFAVWEFFMMFLAMFETTRQMGIASLSVSFWGAEIINSTGWLVWGDYALMSGQAQSIGFFAEIALWTVWFDPFPTTTPILNLVISIVVLLMIVAMFVLIGQSSFKKRELN
jgi:hypothetical protein